MRRLVMAAGAADDKPSSGKKDHSTGGRLGGPQEKGCHRAVRMFRKAGESPTGSRILRVSPNGTSLSTRFLAFDKDGLGGFRCFAVTVDCP